MKRLATALEWFQSLSSYNSSCRTVGSFFVSECPEQQRDGAPGDSTSFSWHASASDAGSPLELAVAGGGAAVLGANSSLNFEIIFFIDFALWLCLLSAGTSCLVVHQGATPVDGAARTVQKTVRPPATTEALYSSTLDLAATSHGLAEVRIAHW